MIQNFNALIRGGGEEKKRKKTKRHLIQMFKKWEKHSKEQKWQHYKLTVCCVAVRFSISSCVTQTFPVV